ncbi:phosphatase PAP2 family protein [Patescibacteria group bacterium]
MEHILNLDYQVLQFINSFAGKNYLVDLFFIICAKYLIFVIAGAVLGWWISLHSIKLPSKIKLPENWLNEDKKKWQIFWNIILAVSSSYLISQLLSLIKFRIRPFLNSAIKQLINPLSEKSFPSDHTTVVFATSLAVYFYNKKLGILLLALSLLIGFARIYTGVHYPLDVLGGIILGCLSAFIFYLILNKKKKEKIVLDKE